MKEQTPLDVFENAQVFKAIFENSNEGLFISDANGQIVFANQSATKMFGYTREELIGSSIELLIPSRFHKAHITHRKEYMKCPAPRPMGMGRDLFAVRKDNSEFPIEVSLSQVDIKEETFTLAFVIDITTRKKAESALKASQKKLKEYTLRLERSNRELEDFAYVSSHDLQEPLRKIQTFGDRIQHKDGGKLSETSQDYLSRMLNSASRMQKLINDLLAFSRVTSKARPFEITDLNEVLSGVLMDLEVAIEKSNAIIETTVLPDIKADELQIRQLFQNLVSNAIKFQKPGITPRVKITGELLTIDQDQAIRIVVEDNGIGFDEKYLDRIFNIFQRLEGRKYEGSGIGLSICKKIALRHGGDITAQSTPGEGSKFITTLLVSPDQAKYQNPL
ncbi:PAS domain S-box protein [Rapidithrix thailandica]|uniref:histidine kinase n=1 Tax=Rapidithrix thailandica TaxID=413964 RepID=A0AAW9S7L4_9BACT